MGPGGEASSVALLNGYDAFLRLHYIEFCLSLCINATVSFGQNDFFFTVSSINFKVSKLAIMLRRIVVGRSALSGVCQPCPPKLREHYRRRGGQIEGQRKGRVLWNAASQTWLGHCTLGLTAPMILCTRPRQDRACHHAARERRGIHKVPALCEDLEAVCGCWRRDRISSVMSSAPAPVKILSFMLLKSTLMKTMKSHTPPKTGKEEGLRRGRRWVDAARRSMRITEGMRIG